MLPQKFLAKTFHLDAEVLDFLVVIAPANERWNRDQQAEQRGIEGETDAGGEFGAVNRTAPAAHAAEESNESVDRADETEQRRDTDDDLEHHQTAFQQSHFVAGARLYQFAVFIARPI